jgi:hypothetical protein
MDLLRFRAKSNNDPERKERLVRIRRGIESSFRFEEDAMSHKMNASILKRLYNIDSLWIVENDDVRKIGSANYSREITVFNDLREKYPNLKSIQIQRGSDKYYVMRTGEKVYILSTPLDMTNSEILMILAEVEGSLPEQKVFLESHTNITEDGS